MGITRLVSPVAEELWLDGCDLTGNRGSPQPVVSNIAGSRFPGPVLPAGRTTGLGRTVQMRASWATNPYVNVELWWLNNGAGTGDVTFSLDLTQLTSGSSNVAYDSVGVVTVTAGAQNVVTKTTLASTLHYTAAARQAFRISRDTTLTSPNVDTLTSDVGVLGLRIYQTP